MATSDRPQVQIANGRWACDFGVSVSLKLDLEPQHLLKSVPPPLPAHIAMIGSLCDKHSWECWPPQAWCESDLGTPPFVEELGKHFRGTLTYGHQGTDPSKTFPTCFNFSDGWPQRIQQATFSRPLPRKEQTVQRVRLNLKPFLQTRGSHCRLDRGEIVGGLSPRGILT